MKHIYQIILGTCGIFSFERRRLIDSSETEKFLHESDQRMKDEWAKTQDTSHDWSNFMKDIHKGVSVYKKSLRNG